MEVRTLDDGRSGSHSCCPTSDMPSRAVNAGSQCQTFHPGERQPVPLAVPERHHLPGLHTCVWASASSFESATNFCELFGARRSRFAAAQRRQAHFATASLANEVQSAGCRSPGMPPNPAAVDRRRLRGLARIHMLRSNEVGACQEAPEAKPLCKACNQCEREAIREHVTRSSG